MMAIAIEIATYIGAIAAVVAAIASVITLCPKAKPGIQRGRVTLPIKSAHNRHPHGSIVLTNKGRKVCHIDYLRIQPVCGIDFEIFIKIQEELNCLCQFSRIKKIAQYTSKLKRWRNIRGRYLQN